MKAKLLRVVAVGVVICAGAFLAIVVAVGVAVGTGWLTSEKVDGMVQVLRGERAVREEAAPGEVIEGELEALQEALKARAELERQRVEEEADLAKKRSDLAVVRQDTERLMREMEAKLRVVAAEVEKLEARKQAYESERSSEALRKAKEAFEQMGARASAPILYEYDTSRAVRLLRAFGKEMRGDVLREMSKIDQERAGSARPGRVVELLKMLETPETEAGRG